MEAGVLGRSKYFAAAAVAAGAVVVSACSGGPSEDDGTSAAESLSTCTFSVTTNTYDGPNYWGTMTVKNTGSSALKGLSVQFDVPSGDHCTNDSVPSGAVLSPLNGTGSSASTQSNVCKFTWSSSKTVNAGRR